MNKRRNRRNQWKNYAAATAGVVGTAVGMEANVARADLLYDVNPDLTIMIGGVLFLDLDQSGSAPFARTTYFAGSDLRLVNDSDNYLWAGLYNGSPGEVLLFSQFNLGKLSAGYSVGPLSTGWSPTDGFGNSFGYFERQNSGFQWDGGGEGFIGVRLNSGPTEHRYGWVHLTYDDSANLLTLHDFAVSEMLDTAITTAVIPEAQSLAACSLALGGVLGAQGVVAYRRRKKMLATA